MEKQKYKKIVINPTTENYKKNIRRLVMLSLSLFLILIGGSYAMFSIVLDGKKELSVTSGILQLNFKDKNFIELKNTYPVVDEEGFLNAPYQFSLENTGNIITKYVISLEQDVQESNIEIKNIKYSLKIGDGNWSDPELLSSLNNLVLDKNILFPASKDTEQKTKIDYQLKLWVSSTAGNEAQDKTFKARIVINSVQDIIPSDSSKIKLIGKDTINIEQNQPFIDPGIMNIQMEREKLNTQNVQINYEYYNGERLIPVDYIDTSKLGTYYIYYEILNSDYQKNVIMRTINVVS